MSLIENLQNKALEAINDADFVILCLPDDAAREAVSLIANDRTRVVDASTAHRTAEDWVYGLAELEPDQAERIAAARFVSNPGCYPTGFLALVRPLVRAGIIPADWPVSVNAALQSIMPAPVDSRSSLTIAAEIVAIVPCPSCLYRNRGARWRRCQRQENRCSWNRSGGRVRPGHAA